jgi:hypothetical protein
MSSSELYNRNLLPSISLYRALLEIVSAELSTSAETEVTREKSSTTRRHFACSISVGTEGSESVKFCCSSGKPTDNFGTAQRKAIKKIK